MEIEVEDEIKNLSSNISNSNEQELSILQQNEQENKQFQIEVQRQEQENVWQQIKENEKKLKQIQNDEQKSDFDSDQYEKELENVLNQQTTNDFIQQDSNPLKITEKDSPKPENQPNNHQNSKKQGFGVKVPRSLNQNQNQNQRGGKTYKNQQKYYKKNNSKKPQHKEKIDIRKIQNQDQKQEMEEELDDGFDEDDNLFTYEKEIKKYYHSYKQFRRYSHVLIENNFFIDFQPSSQINQGIIHKPIKITKPSQFWFIICQEYFSREFIMQNTGESAIEIFKKRLNNIKYTPIIRCNKREIQEEEPQNKDLQEKQEIDIKLKEFIENIEKQNDENIQKLINIEKQEQNKEINYCSKYQNYTFKDDLYIIQMRKILLDIFQKFKQENSINDEITINNQEQQLQNLNKKNIEENQIINNSVIDTIEQQQNVQIPVQNEQNIQQLNSEINKQFEKENQEKNQESQIINVKDQINQEQQEKINLNQQEQKLIQQNSPQQTNQSQPEQINQHSQEQIDQHLQEQINQNSQDQNNQISQEQINQHSQEQINQHSQEQINQHSQEQINQHSQEQINQNSQEEYNNQLQQNINIKQNEQQNQSQSQENILQSQQQQENEPKLPVYEKGQQDMDLDKIKNVDLQLIENYLLIEQVQQQEKNNKQINYLQTQVCEYIENYKKTFQTDDFQDNSNILHDLKGLTNEEQNYITYLENLQHNSNYTISHNMNPEDQIQQYQKKQNQQLIQVACKSKENQHFQFQDYICKVCNEGDYDENNQILMCEKCNISVHQICYGLKKIPSGEWICDVCKSFGPQGYLLRCVLCTKRGGVLKSTSERHSINSRYKQLNPNYYLYQLKCISELQQENENDTDSQDNNQKSYQKEVFNENELQNNPKIQELFKNIDYQKPKTAYYDFYKLKESDFIEDKLSLEPLSQNKWCHLSCASWLPECFFKENKHNEATIQGIDKVDKKRFELQCNLCKQKKMGAILQCSKGKCQIGFHVECARRANFCIEYRPSDKIQYQLFCEKHTPLKLKKILTLKNKKYSKEIINFNKQVSQFLNQFLKNTTIEQEEYFSKIQQNNLDVIQNKKNQNLQIQHEYDFYYDLNYAEEVLIKGHLKKKIEKSNSTCITNNKHQNSKNPRLIQDNQDSIDSYDYQRQKKYNYDSDSESEFYTDSRKGYNKKQKKYKDKFQNKYGSSEESSRPKKMYPKRSGILQQEQVNNNKKKNQTLSQQELDNIEYPYQISNLITLLDPGVVNYKDNAYHSKFNIFPIGYKCQREYASYINLNQKTNYISEILRGKNGKPLYRVTCEEDPDNYIQTESSSSCWKKIAEDVNMLRKGCKNVSISGPEMFALQNPKIQQILSNLPNSNLCKNFYMNLHKPQNQEQQQQNKKNDNNYNTRGSKNNFQEETTQEDIINDERVDEQEQQNQEKLKEQEQINQQQQINQQEQESQNTHEDIHIEIEEIQ